MLSFQDIIFNLKHFWKNNNCTLVEGYDLEVGAATLAPQTAFNILGSKKWNICQVQYCRRPADARNGLCPNRLSRFHQMQVILKPVPSNIQELCVNSLEAIGLDIKNHDIRFIEDDWENPSIGASGLGYEVWFDGMEVIQFTYMKRIGGIDCDIIAGEITYGLERIAMYVQNKDNIFDIEMDDNGMKYSDIYSKTSESQLSEYYRSFSQDNAQIEQDFKNYIQIAKDLIAVKNFTVSYDYCLKASNTLNVLDARNLISQSERVNLLLQIRELVKQNLEAQVNL